MIANTIRIACICCGNPTLRKPALFQVFALCGWKDDGRSEVDVDISLHGFNSDLTLREARRQFSQYLKNDHVRIRGPRLSLPNSVEERSRFFELVDLCRRYIEATDDSARDSIDKQMLCIEKQMYDSSTRIFNQVFGEA
jgi:hypothetical protein